jgi:hypothetical protein
MVELVVVVQVAAVLQVAVNIKISELSESNKVLIYFKNGNVSYVIRYFFYPFFI